MDVTTRTTLSELDDDNRIRKRNTILLRQSIEEDTIDREIQNMTSPSYRVREPSSKLLRVMVRLATRAVAANTGGSRRVSGCRSVLRSVPSTHLGSSWLLNDAER